MLGGEGEASPPSHELPLVEQPPDQFLQWLMVLRSKSLQRMKAGVSMPTDTAQPNSQLHTYFSLTQYTHI